MPRFDPKLPDPAPHSFVGQARVDRSAGSLIEGIGKLAEAGLDYVDQGTQEEFVDKLKNISAQEQAGEPLKRELQFEKLGSDDEAVVARATKELERLRRGELAGKLTSSRASVERKKLLAQYISDHPWLSPELKGLSKTYGGGAPAGMTDPVQEALDQREKELTLTALQTGKSITEVRKFEQAVVASQQAMVTDYPELRVNAENSASLLYGTLAMQAHQAFKANPTSVDADALRLQAHQSVNRLRMDYQMKLSELGIRGVEEQKQAMADFDDMIEDQSAVFDVIIKSKTPQDLRDEVIKQSQFQTQQQFADMQGVAGALIRLSGNDPVKGLEVFARDVLPLMKQMSSPEKKKQIQTLRKGGQLPADTEAILWMMEMFPARAAKMANDASLPARADNFPVEDAGMKSMADSLVQQEVNHYRKTGKLRDKDQSKVAYGTRHAPHEYLRDQSIGFVTSNADQMINYARRLTPQYIDEAIALSEDERTRELSGEKAVLARRASRFVVNGNRPEKGTGAYDIWSEDVRRIAEIDEELAKGRRRVVWTDTDGFTYMDAQPRVHFVTPGRTAQKRTHIDYLSRGGENDGTPLDRLTQLFLLLKRAGNFESKEAEIQWIGKAMERLNKGASEEIEFPSIEEPTASKDPEPQKLEPGFYDIAGKLIKVNEDGTHEEFA